MASHLVAKDQKPKVEAQALRTNGTKTECFSWITRSGGKLQVCTPKPLQRSTHASSKFLNFATILGPARQGKSFLMNCLFGNSMFCTTDNIGVCTKGVQLTSAVHEVGNGGLAFFVDTEGQGDEDVDSDTTLLTPIILLSKVILFNWKGGLQRNQILHELAILVEVGNCVSSKSFEDGTSKFGHLHIVLRDFHFEGTVEEAFAIIFDEENRRGEKVKERNKIREKILSSFESIDVCIIPVPCEDLQNLDPVDTSDEFQETVEELKDVILCQLSKPRRLAGVAVSSQNVDFFVKKFVKELEDGDIVHVKSAIGQLQRGVVDEAKRKFEESLIKVYKEIEVPARDGLEELLIQMRDEHLDVFRKSTAEVDLEAVYRDDVLEDLDRFADRELDAKRKENLLAIQSRIAEQNKILAKAEKQFKSSMESELGKSTEGSRQMRQRFRQCTQTLVDNFSKTTTELNWVLEQRSKKLEELKTWASARQEEKVETKQKEEEYLEKSDQQVRLSKAAEDFRSGVERELARNHDPSTSKLGQEKERLIKVFQTSTHDLNQISQLREAELKKLKSWAGKKIEEKVQALEREKLLREKEHNISRERAMVQALEQSLYVHGAQSSPLSPTYYSPPASSTSYTPATPPSTSSGVKFYKGGQFTPGGGRAPKGGCYVSPNSGFSSRSSGSSAMSFGSSSSSGRSFYKGGQFTPGGGRAPKGGCWK